MKKKWSEVTQSCPTLHDPMDYNLPSSSFHGILQARVLEWVAISFSRGSSRPRDQTWVSCIPGRCFNLWATREALWDYHYNCWLPLTWNLLLLISKLCDMTDRSGAITYTEGINSQYSCCVYSPVQLSVLWSNPCFIKKPYPVIRVLFIFPQWDSASVI